jgi:hypothetical protein
MPRIAAIIPALALLFALCGCDDRKSVKVRQVAKGEPQGPAPEAPPSLPTATASAEAGVSDEPPASWQRQPPSPLRKLSYLISGPGGTRCEVSLVTLGGGAGGTLENVNRWRSQLGLQALDEASLRETTTSPLTTPLGKVLIVDFTGRPEKEDPDRDGRIIAGILNHGSETIFFKLRGNPELAGRSEKDFLKWIGTVRFQQ